MTLYNLFKDFLEEVNDDYQPNDAVGFKDTKIWRLLYPFQKDAVQSIIAKLEQYNGCILADSVGLGKTFTALAVMTYYLKRNKDVLVLCPKKLENNWNQYTRNYKGNPLIDDRLHYDVLYHTDLSRQGGQSNGHDLAQMNWENYDLIVIDESHNFRNGGTPDSQKEQNKMNRYDKLLNEVIRKGKKTKVLMLSATPVNNRFLDLKNQLALAYEGSSEQLEKELKIDTTIDNVFRNAQKAYSEWEKLPVEERTNEALLDRLDYDFFKLLDSVTIARSRKHIVEFYDTQAIGDFPTRRPPVNLQPSLTSHSEVIDYHQIYEQLDQLNLVIYQPMAYVHPSKRFKYEEERKGKEKNLTRDGQELGTKKLMQINLLKRLESSIFAFNKTATGILEKINQTIAKIDDFIQNQTETVVEDDIGDSLVNQLDDDNLLAVGNKKKPILLSDMDYVSWKNELLKDQQILSALLNRTKTITPAKDGKLQNLYSLIDQKVLHPINTANHKILIFSAFADTANYLYENISVYAKENYGLNVGRVSGSDRVTATIDQSKLELNQLMSYFSPKSKHRDEIYGVDAPDIDILIATDVISEGQNLQDCDMVVNYDIHWNPVRIVQRFGRVDRIGSQNKEIQLVNFWPNVELDEYINLRNRVEERMTILDLSGTGDDNLLSPDDHEAIYRKQQLERMQNETIDLEDVNGGISIMDLGLEDYRMALRAYLQEHPEVANAPAGLYTVLESDESNPPGVIFILKNINPDCVDYSQNRLYPYYLIYITDEGEVEINHLHSKELLARLRALSKGQTQPLESLYQKFNEQTKDGTQMSHYSNLLSCAITQIVKKSDESQIESLFTNAGIDLMTDNFTGAEDFQLISFFVVLYEDAMLPIQTQLPQPKVIPKKQLMAHISMNNREKNDLTQQIQKISITHQLDEKTLHLPTGKEVQQIMVFQVLLKGTAYSESLLKKIADAFPFKVIYQLVDENQDIHWLISYHNGSLNYSYLSDLNMDLNVEGYTLDEVYKQFIHQISSISGEIDNQLTIAEQLEQDEQIKKLEKQIQQLHQRMSKEKSIKKQIELKKECSQLQKTLKETIN